MLVDAQLFTVVRDPWQRLLSSYRYPDPDLVALYRWRTIGICSASAWPSTSMWPAGRPTRTWRPQLDLLTRSGSTDPDPRLSIFRQEQLPRLEQWLSQQCSEAIQLPHQNAARRPLPDLPDQEWAALEQQVRWFTQPMATPWATRCDPPTITFSAVAVPGSAESQAEIALQGSPFGDPDPPEPPARWTPLRRPQRRRPGRRCGLSPQATQGGRTQPGRSGTDSTGSDTDEPAWAHHSQVDAQQLTRCWPLRELKPPIPSGAALPARRFLRVLL